MAEESSSNEAKEEKISYAKRISGVFVALVVLGSVVQLCILAIALPFCNHDWHCAHGWYKAFISHIDGPFKIMTFVAAVKAAQAKPDFWLSVVGVNWLFGERRSKIKISKKKDQ